MYTIGDPKRAAGPMSCRCCQRRRAIGVDASAPLSKLEAMGHDSISSMTALAIDTAG
jgi:hypothetical protein